MEPNFICLANFICIFASCLVFTGKIHIFGVINLRDLTYYLLSKKFKNSDYELTLFMKLPYVLLLMGPSGSKPSVPIISEYQQDY